MNTYDATIHPELAYIVNFAPTLVKLINAEVTLVISDTEKIICCSSKRNYQACRFKCQIR